MKISIKTIANFCEALHFEYKIDTTIQEIFIDSRQKLNPENALFFALKGNINNAHRFIPELYAKGFKNFVVSETFDFEQYPKANFIVVFSTTQAIQRLATAYRKLNKYTQVAAITGSNGKTIVKEWLNFLLKDQFKLCVNPKSYNSQIGVPLSVMNLNDDDELAIFEAGISQPGEMEKLEKIIQPSIGIFTRFGDAHSENFSDNQSRLIEKCKLFEHCNSVICASNEKEFIGQLRAMYPNVNIVSYGIEKSNQIVVKEIKSTNQTTEIDIEIDSKNYQVTIPFTDQASIDNALNCITFCDFLKIPLHSIAPNFKQLPSVEMRLQMLQGINNCEIINDSYNSDLESLKIALEFWEKKTKKQKKILILSDIQQSMKSEEELYQKLFTLLKLYRFDEFYSIGEKFGQHNAKFQLFKNTHFKTSLELKEFLKQHPPENTSILIKGARIFKLEEICALLQQKIHETTLEVNLSAVAKNYTFFKQKLRQGTKIMGMVKAFSYGSGAVEIASLLETMQIDYLAVAYVDEGIELRKNGIKTPIMVMKPDDNAFVLMQEFNLEPVIYNQLILNKLNAYTSISGNTITAHLEVDSGMNRLGFELNEIDDAIAIFKKNKQLKISSVFSHLAASDEPDFDGFTHEQIDSFKLEVEKIKNVLPYPILVHLCNSNAILRFPEAHFDMVRLGIGMFGTAVVASSADALQPVATLKTNIAQIRTVFPNESVGYNRNGKVNKISKIASIPIGYADGILRKAGNGNATFLVNGKPCPTIGNICMDLCMIDVTEVDCKEGDVVIVFSPEFPIENLAKSLETIPYEVLTNISQRVKRVYYEE